MIQLPPAHLAQHVQDSACHMGIGTAVQDSEILCKHARMLSLDGSTMVLEGSTTAMCANYSVHF